MQRQRRGPDLHSHSVVARALAARAHAGAPGAATAHLLAHGDGWSAKDIVCTHGRTDRPFEERHSHMSVALVLAGTFQYRSGHAHELLAPGALLLGNHGECFECSHEHAAGDRCVAFHFTPDYFERVAADAGHRRATFAAPRIPPVRELARVSTAVATNLLHDDKGKWEEIAVEMAAHALALANRGEVRDRTTSQRTLARITESVRVIEANPAAPHTIQSLAAAAGVGVFYYLRVFERVTGVTPHQFILRARLRAAAVRIAHEDTQIATIAFASGFGDLSNFNHTFRAEFGMTPRQWRNQSRAPRST